MRYDIELEPFKLLYVVTNLLTGLYYYRYNPQPSRVRLAGVTGITRLGSRCSERAVETQDTEERDGRVL